jgi:hypothetical protein
MEVEYIFNDEVAPLEEIAIQLSTMWYGDERTGQEMHKEVGKLTPAQFEQSIYDAVHLLSMQKMEDIKYQGLKDALNEEIGEYSEAELKEKGIKGHEYAIDMWTARANNEGIGGGFVELLEEFHDDIGPSSWDHNPELIKFTDYWSNQFSELSPIEKYVATYTFLQGFYKFNQIAESDKQGKPVKGKHVNVLPPISDQSMFTVLDPNVMSQYLAHYNSIISNTEERMQTAGYLTNYERFSTLIKKACK